jgi:hypothetical protein
MFFFMFLFLILLYFQWVTDIFIATGYTLYRYWLHALIATGYTLLSLLATRSYRYWLHALIATGYTHFGFK